MDLENDTEQASEASAPRLSQKERAKKFRQQAYQRAKEFKKNDPRELVRKEQAKAFRKAAYQKAKERNKEANKAKKQKTDLSSKLVRAAELAADDRPLAPVITLDDHRFKKKT